MTPGSHQPNGRTRRLGGALLIVLVLLVGHWALAACTGRESQAGQESQAGNRGERLFLPFISSAPGPTPSPTHSDVFIEGVLQNGPENQILVLRNRGTGSQQLGGWTIDLEGSGPIYHFPGSIITPFGGKIWITTSRESRLSVFSLGYFAHEAGRRYIPGNEVILRDSEGNEVHRYVVREIGELPLPEPP